MKQKFDYNTQSGFINKKIHPVSLVHERTDLCQRHLGNCSLTFAK
jgi:hypothetical protein